MMDVYEAVVRSIRLHRKNLRSHDRPEGPHCVADQSQGLVVSPRQSELPREAEHFS